MTEAESYEAIEKASAQDRLYFERNPEACQYVRGLIPGEFWPMTETGAFVIVTKVNGDVRLRQQARWATMAEMGLLPLKPNKGAAN